MRAITVVLFCVLVTLASGYYMTKDVKYADKDFLKKQAYVFEILQHIHQHDLFFHKYGDYINYNIKDHFDDYDYPDFVKAYIEVHEKDPLGHGEIFTIFNDHHEEHAEGLVAAFYYAKDFDVFNKTVIWARHHVNHQLFVYAFTVAVLHRPDFQGIVLPAIYEVYPYYFFGAETIQRAQLYKMQGFYGVKKVEDVYNVVIPANYTGIYGHVNEDNLLAYFTEDVGLNSFYYYYNLDYPHWANGDPNYALKKDRRGEFYFFLHWQLLARYYLERLSHGLGEVDEFSFYDHTHAGYYSGLRYYNGVHFPDRDNHYSFYHPENYHLVDLAEIYHSRILDSIDLEKFVQADGKYYTFADHSVQDVVDHLGAIVQGSEESLNHKFYGHFDGHIRYLVNEGIPYGKHEETLPGLLMHYETSLRDPLFYEVYKRILRFYWHYIDNVTPYTYEELNFDGVKVENVEMDKLVTYYDKFDADISNCVDVEHYDEAHSTAFGKFGRLSQHEGHDFVIKARQYRLNHLPFNFKLTVTSDKAQKAVVKVFVGPKYDSYGHKIYLTENRKNFVELDHFVTDLNAGKNVISRSSNDFSWFVNDRTTYYDLYHNVLLGVNSADHKFPLDMSEAHCGFPNRLLLPRGRKGGQAYQFFYFVYPYHEPKVKQFTGYDPVVSCGVGSGARYVDDTSFGYPFDRNIDFKHWHHDNMYFYDTMIYFKTEAEVNAVH